MIRLFANPFVAAVAAAMLHRNLLRSPREQHGGNRVLALEQEVKCGAFRRASGSYYEAATPLPRLYRGVAHLFFMHGSVARRPPCAPNR